MKRVCQNCGGIPVFPPDKKVMFYPDLDGWYCHHCIADMKRKYKEWYPIYKKYIKRSENRLQK